MHTSTILKLSTLCWRRFFAVWWEQHHFRLVIIRWQPYDFNLLEQLAIAASWFDRYYSTSECSNSFPIIVSSISYPVMCTASYNSGWLTDEAELLQQATLHLSNTPIHQYTQSSFTHVPLQYTGIKRTYRMKIILLLYRVWQFYMLLNRRVQRIVVMTVNSIAFDSMVGDSNFPSRQSFDWQGYL